MNLGCTSASAGVPASQPGAAAEGCLATMKLGSIQLHHGVCRFNRPAASCPLLIAA